MKLVCLLGALECYILVGKVLATTDADFAFFHNYVASFFSFLSPPRVATDQSEQQGDAATASQEALEITINPIAAATASEVVLDEIYSTTGREKTSEGVAKMQYTLNPLQKSNV